MSYVLHFFASKIPRDPLHAQRWIDQNLPPPHGSQARFNEFVNAITPYLPGSGGSGAGAGFWPEGLTPAKREERAYGVMVDTTRLTDALLGLVAKMAQQCGLQILDPQGGLLYRLDGTVVDLNGRTAPYPAAAVLPRQEAALGPALSGAKLRAAMRPHLEGPLRQCGFTLDARTDQNDSLYFDRLHGEILQSIRVLFVEGADGPDRFSVMIQWELRCPALRELWRPLFEPAITQRAKHWRPEEAEFAFVHHFIPGSLSPEPFAGKSEVRRIDEIGTLGPALATWIAYVIARNLDPVSSLPALADMVVGDTPKYGHNLPDLINFIVLAARWRPDRIETAIEYARRVCFNQWQWRDRLDDQHGKTYFEPFLEWARREAAATLGQRDAR